MKNLLSQSSIPLFDEGRNRLKGFGPLGEAENAPSLLNQFFSSVIGIISVVAFLWLMFIIITGAIGIMGAGGDKNAVSNNAKKITNGIIGIVILISSIFLIQLLGTLLKIDFLSNLNLGEVLTKLNITK